MCGAFDEKRADPSQSIGQGAPSQSGKATAHMLNRRPMAINGRWRISSDNIQWLVQYLSSIANGEWSNRSFCRTRDGLIRAVKQKCGEVDDQVLGQIERLPQRFVDWFREA